MASKLGESENEELFSRVGLYEFYSKVFLREFSLEQLKLFHCEPWNSTFSELGISLPVATEDSVEDLAVDYCQIFIGPKEHVPPIQSVWQSGQLQSSISESMNSYLEFVTPTEETSIKDHFGVQLEIMSMILRASIENEHLRIEAEQFLEQHLRWSIPMIHRAAEKAETKFYQSVLSSALKFIEMELNAG